MNSPAIAYLPINDIDASKRLRPVNAAGVAALRESITELGVMKDPIHVRRKGRGDKVQHVLMAGGHRLQAMKELGHESIACFVHVDVTDDFARLIEIDDNLAGSDLSALELSVFLAERKAVYERLHPETKHGAVGGRGGKKIETDIVSFSKSVAEQRELTPRHIRRFVAIGQRLSEWEITRLQSAEKQPTMKDLMALAKIDDEAVRADVVDRLAHGTAKNAAAAHTAVLEERGEAQPGPKLNSVDAAFAKLSEAWSRAPVAAQRMFVETNMKALQRRIEEVEA